MDRKPFKAVNTYKILNGSTTKIIFRFILSVYAWHSYNLFKGAFHIIFIYLYGSLDTKPPLMVCCGKVYPLNLWINFPTASR